jgi:hypothetical protein
VALFKSRAKREDEAEGAGSALALWQLDRPSTPTNGERRPPAASPPAAMSGSGRSEDISEPEPDKPANEEPRDKGSELARRIEEIEGRHAEALEQSEQVLEDARRVLESMETHATDAETHAERAARLANEMSKYRRQEADFQALIDKIKAAEGRAVAADRRAREAMESISERSTNRIAHPPRSRRAPKPKTTA